MTLESDDLEELTKEIRKLIESNRLFLERVGDEEYDEEEEEAGPEPAAAPDDYEEL